MNDNQELLNVQIQYKLIEKLKETNHKLQKRIAKEISLKKEIRKINAELKKNVAEQSKRNLLLSNALYEQEIMASIGEISSGIAHDLNTPLGAIKTSTESIRFTLKSFFENDIEKISVDEFEYAYKRVMKINSISVFMNSSQQKQHAYAFETLLNKHYPKLNNIPHLSTLFANARIETDEIETIKKIIQAKNPVAFLHLIDKFQKIHSFIDTILYSSDRANKVVQGLSGFVKKQTSEYKEKINLKENISTLINVFNYEINSDIQILIDIEEELEIIGFESKLFQLWSNLLKNAIFAVNQMSKSKKIHIYSINRPSEIDIVFENNGPSINEKEQKLIFKKFFTTKKNEGTGLGLGIVKSVVDAHQGKIELISNNRRTAFIITFKKEDLKPFSLN